MRIAVFILLLGSVINIAQGQGRLNKVLEIDKLAGVRDHFRVGTCTQTQYTFSRYVNYWNNVRMTPFTISADCRPGVRALLSADTVTDDVLISLDDSGGYLVLRNVFLIPGDTLHIDKLEVFRSCIPDTLMYEISWYRKIPFDTTAHGRRLLRHKSKIISINRKADGSYYPEQLRLVINGKSYNVVIQPEMIYTDWFFCHGYRRRDRHRYYELQWSGKPYKVFAGVSYRRKHILFADLELE